MIEIHITAENDTQLRAHLGTLIALVNAARPPAVTQTVAVVDNPMTNTEQAKEAGLSGAQIPNETTETPAPQKRTRKAKPENVTEPVNPGPAVTGNGAPRTTVGESVFAAAAPVVDAPKVDQKQLFVTFRAVANTLGKEKGTDALLTVLRQFVPGKTDKELNLGLLPEASWGAACVKVRELGGLTDDAAFKAAVAALK